MTSKKQFATRRLILVVRGGDHGRGGLGMSSSRDKSTVVEGGWFTHVEA